jgi:hypothetical protein
MVRQKYVRIVPRHEDWLRRSSASSRLDDTSSSWHEGRTSMVGGAGTWRGLSAPADGKVLTCGCGQRRGHIEGARHREHL